MSAEPPTQLPYWAHPRVFPIQSFSRGVARIYSDGRRRAISPQCTRRKKVSRANLDPEHREASLGGDLGTGKSIHIAPDGALGTEKEDEPKEGAES